MKLAKLAVTIAAAAMLSACGSADQISGPPAPILAPAASPAAGPQVEQSNVRANAVSPGESDKDKEPDAATKRGRYAMAAS